MKNSAFIPLLFLLIGCANMIAPTGGEKDIDAPKILNKTDPKNFTKKNPIIINFEFNEYIQPNKWEENFYISPPIKKGIQKKIKGTELTLTIKDSLSKESTYFINMQSCIKDLNEGNILETLNYLFCISDKIDTLHLSGELKDAYTLDPIENAWVMLFEESREDSIIFIEEPNYIAKTNKKGTFHFPNLNDKNYSMVALTGFDFIYSEKEKIAFSDSTVNAKKDSFVSLFVFDPIIKTDSSVIALSKEIVGDQSLGDTLLKEKNPEGKLEIITSENIACIFQLLQDKKVIKEQAFAEEPFVINSIVPGKYELKYIVETKKDSVWNTGNWDKKIQAEKVINYPDIITIRSNWDLVLEWLTQE